MKRSLGGDHKAKFNNSMMPISERSISPIVVQNLKLDDDINSYGNTNTNN